MAIAGPNAGVVHAQTANQNPSPQPNSQVNTIAKDDFRLVLDRYREFLLRTPSMDAEKLNGYVTTLVVDGRWPDIDYADQLLAGWKTAEHLSRVKALSHALANGKSPLYNDVRVESAISAIPGEPAPETSGIRPKAIHAPLEGGKIAWWLGVGCGEPAEFCSYRR